MKSLIRKAVLLGMGGYQYAKEGIQDLVKELEKEGKMTPEEGKKLVDEVVEKGQKVAEEQTSELRKVVKSVMDEMGLVTKDDLEDLKKELKKKK